MRYLQSVSEASSGERAQSHGSHSPAQDHPRRGHGDETPVPRRALLLLRPGMAESVVVLRVHWSGGLRLGQRGSALLAIQVVAGVVALSSRAVPASDLGAVGMQSRTGGINE